MIPEEWGGDAPFIPVSAKLGTGIDDLLEAVLLQAEVLELKATPSAPGRGVVVESRLDKGRGPVATVLVQDGTLRQGDVVLCGVNYGRVRAMLDENGKNVKEAGPSIPVAILGLDGTPEAGDDLTVVADEKKAREVALFRQGKFREVKLARQQSAKLENIFETMGQDEKKMLNIVLKTDVRGTWKPCRRPVRAGQPGSSGARGRRRCRWYHRERCQPGAGFQCGAVRLQRACRRRRAQDRRAGRPGSALLQRHLRHHRRRQEGADRHAGQRGARAHPGHREVRDVFRSPKFGAVAGCMVVEGIVHRNRPIRVLREDVVIFEGELESLRRFKDDVAEVRAGMECGIGVKSYNDVKVGDKIEVFEKVQVPVRCKRTPAGSWKPSAGAALVGGAGWGFQLLAFSE